VEVWAVVVAAGSGSRFGRPKQYELLAGRRVLDWSVEAARRASDGVVLVVPADRAGDSEPAADVVVAGGDRRSASVRAGLGEVPSSADVVVVHDAARPLASPELFRAVIDAVAGGADGAVPGIAVVDTVKRVRDGVVEETLDRDALVAVQTPQAFAAAVLRRAHAAGADASDDAALVEAVGGRVVVVPGDVANVKLTTADELAVVESRAVRR
jgi:2-C-methyl-D-erythritol 4-phosphate cytidylyltransferase